jgi:hypothetical protein
MFPLSRKRFTAYVFFQGAEHRRFWRIFTRRGWRHVFVVLPVYRSASLADDVASMVINPVLHCVETDVYFHHPAKLAQEALRDGVTCVIKIRIDRSFKRDYVPRGLFTCVSLIKSILGISAWYVWTPEHLARFLLRNGGQLVERDPTYDVALRHEETQARHGNVGKPAPAGPSLEETGNGRSEGNGRS